MPDFTFFSSNISRTLVVMILVLTFMTKRALYPFSPWLPMAMAAPTPISALVHSSTLVTAGLYLMIRFSYLLYSSPDIIKYLFVARIFTSFYAGINTIFEVDLKKLIALSTLSHLGFIGMAFSIGMLYLRFFHLLVHALFKSLLFMTIGDIMINLNHAQDARYLSGGYFITPFSVFLIRVSLLNLLGLPSLSGFFSKDLVLETMSYSNAS
jgi:NADH-ubiquinone oxidoreductase chain 5